MVKYVANTFLATKVSFANEINQICKRSQIDYDDVIKLATLDERLGESHWEVPGPDGHYGFGGSCFPKDVNGLASFASQIGIEPSMLLATWHKNLEVRPEKDWESLIGRAITKEKNNE
jgi:UDPglucose 6-dehydrogenase